MDLTGSEAIGYLGQRAEVEGVCGTTATLGDHVAPDDGARGVVWAWHHEDALVQGT